MRDNPTNLDKAASEQSRAARRFAEPDGWEADARADAREEAKRDAMAEAIRCCECEALASIGCRKCRAPLCAACAGADRLCDKCMCAAEDESERTRYR